MSGVLDRMAKRARGALPRVEPRGLARFAPAAPAFPDPYVPSADMQEVFAEMPASPSDREVLPRRRQQSPRESLAGKSAGKQDDEAALIRESGIRTAAGQTDSRDDSQWQQVSEVSLRRPESPQAEQARLDAAENISTVQQTRSVKKNRGEMPPSRRPQALEFSPSASGQIEMSGPQPESLLDSPLVEVMAEQEASFARVTPPVRADALRQGQRQEQRGTLRNDAPATTPELPAEQRTEIHISIGSIELRAPRMEARPQAAPFRPRVALSDYLGRKPEAGA